MGICRMFDKLINLSILARGLTNFSVWRQFEQIFHQKMHNFKFSKFSKFLSKFFWGKWCAHTGTQIFWKLIFEIMHFFCESFFLKFPSDAKFRETARQNWEILRYVEHSAHAHNFFLIIFNFQNHHFLWKIRTFLILSPLSARRNFCTARQIFRILKPHLWLSPQFFSDLYELYLKNFVIWTTFRWIFYTWEKLCFYCFPKIEIANKAQFKV